MTQNNTTQHYNYLLQLRGLAGKLLRKFRNSAKKIFYVSLGANFFVVRIFNRHCFFYRRNVVVHFSTSNPGKINPPAIDVYMKRITLDNLESFRAVNSSIDDRKQYIEQKKGPCEGFGLWTMEGDKPAGYLWLMYRGGNIGNFRFKDVDAWIFSVLIGEEYRRKGCCEYMLRTTLEYLHSEKNIDSAYLEVLENNTPARTLYRKAGGIEFYGKSFKLLRLCFSFLVPMSKK